ncbi:MAG TPA: Uma2 family endonuclease [Solirubrobacteraceae bacterium]|nr:Uma2 family endonuclease [Solirubrobacteraceae bacterium]
MPTLVNDPQPVELTKLIERRRALGQDMFDEVWDGVLHMNPGPAGAHGLIEHQLVVVLSPLAKRAGLISIGQFNLGEGRDNFRVPDIGLHRAWEDRTFYPTAALVVEIVSPGDESYQKFDFYAAHGVDELLIVDPQQHRVHWFRLVDEEYLPVEQSGLIELGPDGLAARIDWPE